MVVRVLIICQKFLLLISTIHVRIVICFNHSFQDNDPSLSLNFPSSIFVVFTHSIYQFSVQAHFTLKHPFSRFAVLLLLLNHDSWPLSTYFFCKMSLTVIPQVFFFLILVVFVSFYIIHLTFDFLALNSLDKPLSNFFYDLEANLKKDCLQLPQVEANRVRCACLNSYSLDDTNCNWSASPPLCLEGKSQQSQKCFSMSSW